MGDFVKYFVRINPIHLRVLCQREIKSAGSFCWGRHCRPTRDPPNRELPNQLDLFTQTIPKTFILTPETQIPSQSIIFHGSKKLGLGFYLMRWVKRKEEQCPRLERGGSHQQREERLGTPQGPWRSRPRALAPFPNPRGEKRKKGRCWRNWERRERRGAEPKRKEVERDGPRASVKLDPNPLWIQRAALPALMGGTAALPNLQGYS